MDQAWEPTPGAPHLRWGDRPSVHRPVLVTAFEGWNDAGDAATAALSFLHEQWDARVVADIDPEEFFDFTATRPRVELDEDEVRQIVWPANELSAATVPATGRSVLFFRGVVPQLRWRTFCDHVLAAADALDVELVVTLGALLAEVPHSRPVPVFGAAYEQRVIDELGLNPSRYEGPTGIVGVLHAACQDRGMRSASLWAAVPTYVPGAPSPKAALALLQRVGLLLETEIDTTSLDLASASYERQVSDLVTEDDETTEYVEALEQRYDDETVGDPQSLVEQVERFLREREQRD
jgi:proteasome assembly chaperone (PAC2) family protein